MSVLTCNRSVDGEFVDRILVIGKDDAAGLGVETFLGRKLDIPVTYRCISFDKFILNSRDNFVPLVIVRTSEISLSANSVCEALNKRLPHYILQGPADHPALRILLQQQAVAAYVSEAKGVHGVLRALNRYLLGERKFTVGLASGRETEQTARVNETLGRVDPSIKPRANLSLRESQIIRDYALGNSMKEIALRFDISPKSVETYKRRAMKKMGCQSRYELLAGGKVIDIGALR